MRLGKALGPSAKFWMDLQKAYDLARARSGEATDRIEPLVSRPPEADRTMMQALEDGMEARPGVYQRLTAS